MSIGVIIVDHGSRRDESNQLLLRVVDLLAAASDCPGVGEVNMELGEPSIGAACSQCVARGATTVVVFPYFLLPGRHWDEDIPRLAAAAAANHPGVRHLVTSPIGVHALMANIIADRISQCLAHAAGESDGCELCQGTDHCSFVSV
mgnify:CR=1 FL=1